MKRMTRKEAAEYLGVSISTISNYMAEGLLGGYKDGDIYCGKVMGNCYTKNSDIYCNK